MNKKGFTLIELMVVIIIMGLLAAVGVPKLIGVIAKSHATEIQPAAASYIKLQKAYMSEKGGVGTWKKIGYAAPGKKVSSGSALTYETSYFTYGGSDVEINATVKRAELATKLSSEKIGWIAKNRNALNECAAGNQWTVKIVAINDTTVQYKADVGDVSAACVALVPNWNQIDNGFTYKDNDDATKTIAPPEDDKQSSASTSDEEEKEEYVVDAQEAKDCHNAGWLNGAKVGWEHSHEKCFTLRQEYFTNGILTCVGNDLGEQTTHSGTVYQKCTKFDYTALGKCKIFDVCVVEIESSSSTVIAGSGDGSGDNTGSGDGTGSSSASSSGGIPGTPAGTGAESSSSSEELTCAPPANQEAKTTATVTASVSLSGCRESAKSITIVESGKYDAKIEPFNGSTFTISHGAAKNNETHTYTLTVTCGNISVGCGSFSVHYKNKN